MNTISGIRPPLPVDTGAVQSLGSPSRTGSGAASFQEVMTKSLDKVNELHHSAQSTALRFLQGEPIEVHQVALEQQQAAMAFDLLLEARNKVVNAYQEVMRMPL